MSINSIRSMLSIVVGKIEGYNTGQHPLVSRFMKGVGRLRPVHAKYNVTWDVEAVFQLFRKWPCDLSLELLSYKTVGLLSLVTGQRVQTLSSILLKDIFIDSNIKIRLRAMLKCTSRNNPNPVLNLPPFHNDTKLCIVDTLKKYLEITKPFRTEASDTLFISFRKPYKPVSAQTISKWLKKLLFMSGIDCDRFTAHTFRHASSSKAAMSGLNTDSIMKCVGWSPRSRVFATYYKKQIESSDSYANAVLGNIN